MGEFMVVLRVQNPEIMHAVIKQLKCEKHDHFQCPWIAFFLRSCRPNSCFW